MAAAMRVQQAYDHRLKFKVYQGEREPAIAEHRLIPRSTIATWKSHPPKRVVTLACDQTSAIQLERETLIVENQR